MPETHILVVEDELDVREMLSFALRGEGYAVDVAGTAAEAWRQLNARFYDVMIADWRLPDGDGLAIADWAQEQGSRTVIMSGYLFHMPGGRADRHETLMKPIRPSEIVAVVERSIRRGECSLERG